MAFNDAFLALIGAYVDSQIGYLSLHTADPGATGLNESTAARQVPSFTVDGDGDLTLDATVNFTGGASGGPCTYVGLQTAASGGTFLGSYALSGDATFNAAGEYAVTSLTINGTAS